MMALTGGWARAGGGHRQGRAALAGAVAVDDREAAVAAEVAAGDFDARGRLAAFVFAAVDKGRREVNGAGGHSAGDHFAAAAVVLDIGFEDGVENVVGREGILVFLVGAEFGGGGADDDCVGDDFASGGFVEMAGELKTRVLGTSLMTAKPPAISP